MPDDKPKEPPKPPPPPPAADPRTDPVASARKSMENDREALFNEEQRRRRERDG